MSLCRLPGAGGTTTNRDEKWTKNIAVVRKIRNLQHLNFAVAANDPTATVRASAITALGHRCIGLTEYWPLLANRCHFAFNSPYVGIRFSVSFAIGCLCDDSLLPPLIALLHDTDDDVRDWAAFAINQQGYNSAELRAILTIMLNDRHEGVRTEAEIWFEEHEERPFLQNTTAS
ncbi:HEAT repeat domain-containing protein [Escherichia albertii]|nr:HEAT repeat domain-containing protein [Escherichia albertii]